LFSFLLFFFLVDYPFSFVYNCNNAKQSQENNLLTQPRFFCLPLSHSHTRSFLFPSLSQSRFAFLIISSQWARVIINYGEVRRREARRCFGLESFSPIVSQSGTSHPSHKSCHFTVRRSISCFRASRRGPDAEWAVPDAYLL
jgi:hypothetical protein